MRRAGLSLGDSPPAFRLLHTQNAVLGFAEAVVKRPNPGVTVIQISDLGRSKVPAVEIAKFRK